MPRSRRTATGSWPRTHGTQRWRSLSSGWCRAWEAGWWATRGCTPSWHSTAAAAAFPPSPSCGQTCWRPPGWSTAEAGTQFAVRLFLRPVPLVFVAGPWPPRRRWRHCRQAAPPSTQPKVLVVGANPTQRTTACVHPGALLGFVLAGVSVWLQRVVVLVMLMPLPMAVLHDSGNFSSGPVFASACGGLPVSCAAQLSASARSAATA
mmetsp:Transcript_64586/g.200240  ORF Transcript_64586/g.200240 Transcript_64586/m.200240 type:complete len:206 (-) Transcript_64586:175-792(-)